MRLKLIYMVEYSAQPSSQQCVPFLFHVNQVMCSSPIHLDGRIIKSYHFTFFVTRGNKINSYRKVVDRIRYIDEQFLQIGDVFIYIVS